MLQQPAALAHGHEDGQAVRGGQADGCDAREAAEGGRRAEVDQSEKTVDDGRERQRPEGNAPALTHAAPQARAGDRAVACKGVRAPAAGGQGADAGEEPDAQDQEEQAEAAGRGAGGGLEDDADGLAVGHVEEGLHVGQDKEDGDEVDQPGQAGRDHGEHDGLGDLALGVLHFLAHGRDHAIAREHVRRLQ